MDRAEATSARSLQYLVGLLRRDVLAVEAAVLQQWSIGPVEGDVNPLKAIKRPMYGRALVELFRARLNRLQQPRLPSNENEKSTGNERMTHGYTFQNQTSYVAESRSPSRSV